MVSSLIARILSFPLFLEDNGHLKARDTLDLKVLLKSIASNRILVLAIAIPALAGPSAIAHGGGLDSQGCHTNSKTGTRHCHRSGAFTSKSSPGLVSGPVSLRSVGDGDTVRVANNRGEIVTVRLACIDAPENSQGASGKWSTQALKGLILGRSISLKPQVKDRYGRTVAEIYVGTQNINLEMVQLGAAYAYRQYLTQCDRDRYLEAEADATRKGLGVWGPYKPDQVPWEFRRLKRR